MPETAPLAAARNPIATATASSSSKRSGGSTAAGAASTGYPSSRSRSMSLRTVRVVTPRRSASCGPVQSRRAWRSDSSRSSRAEVRVIPQVWPELRNDSFRIGSSVRAMTNEIRPFRIEIPAAEVADLRARLSATR